MKFAHVRTSGHFTFAEQIFHREAISFARKGKFRCVPALRQVRVTGAFLEINYVVAEIFRFVCVVSDGDHRTVGLITEVYQQLCDSLL